MINFNYLSSSNIQQYIKIIDNEKKEWDKRGNEF